MLCEAVSNATNDNWVAAECTIIIYRKCRNFAFAIGYNLQQFIQILMHGCDLVPEMYSKS